MASAGVSGHYLARLSGSAQRNGRCASRTRIWDEDGLDSRRAHLGGGYVPTSAVCSSPPCVALVAGTLAYTASATVPTNKLYAMMNGAQEAPRARGCRTPAGAAIFTVKPATNQVCVNVRFARVDGTLSGFHIHDGPRGTRRPDRRRPDLGAFDRRATGVGRPPPRSITAIRNNPKRFYCNVHSTPAFGAGAIRSQLFDSDI